MGKSRKTKPKNKGRMGSPRPVVSTSKEESAGREPRDSLSQSDVEKSVSTTEASENQGNSAPKMMNFESARQDEATAEISEELKPVSAPEAVEKGTTSLDQDPMSSGSSKHTNADEIMTEKDTGGISKTVSVALVKEDSSEASFKLERDLESTAHTELLSDSNDLSESRSETSKCDRIKREPEFEHPLKKVRQDHSVKESLLPEIEGPNVKSQSFSKKTQSEGRKGPENMARPSKLPEKETILKNKEDSLKNHTSLESSKLTTSDLKSEVRSDPNISDSPSSSTQKKVLNESPRREAIESDTPNQKEEPSQLKPESKQDTTNKSSNFLDPKDVINPSDTQSKPDQNNTIVTNISVTEPEKTPASPPLSNPSSLPSGWSLQKLELEIPLKTDEYITCVSSFEANLYVGTSKGQILHLHLFEDADQYMFISQNPVSEPAGQPSPVTKILVVSDANMCLVLSANTVHSYTLPELSPCRIGKIRDALDLSLLSVGKLKSEKNKSDKVVVYTKAKLRVVHVIQTGLKLLRDISYMGATTGVSSATGTSAHYSNICIVANETRYDVVDMQQARKIPLFDYNPGAAAGVRPLVIPYIAQDDAGSREEYVLPIASDPQTGMAMFVNSEGDVTRGTLLWPDLGYPVGGLSVAWPLVIGIFQNQISGKQMAVFSSLISLEVVACIECESLFGGNDQNLAMIVNSGQKLKVADLELSRLLGKVSAASRTPVSFVKNFNYSETVFTSGQALFCLQKQDPLAETLQRILDVFEDTSKMSDIALSSSIIEYFSKHASNDDFNHAMHIVLLLLTSKFASVQKLLAEPAPSGRMLDPRLILLYYVDLPEIQGPFWEEYHVQHIFLLIREENSALSGDADKPFLHWFIKNTYAFRDRYDDSIRDHFRKLSYMESCKTLEEVLDLIDSESGIWSSQNATNSELSAYFEDQNMWFALLRVFQLKQAAGNPFEQWPLKIVDLSLELLAGSKVDGIMENVPAEGICKISSYTFDLPKIAFSALRDHVEDEPIYTKRLFRLLQLCPERGLAFLESVKSKNFLEAHKSILSELSKSHRVDAKFALLKIEYSEQAFLEDIEKNGKVDFALTQELLDNCIEFLNQEELTVEHENLNILFATYQVENTLEDPQWPKVTWIEYLHLHHRKSECESFFKVYLKLYELIVIQALCDRETVLSLDSRSDATQFLVWVSEANYVTEIKLREMKDFSSAEYIVFHPHPPPPRKSFYFQLLQKLDIPTHTERPKEISKEGLVRLIGEYLALQNPTAKSNSVMHAVNTYAAAYLSVEDVLNLLPEEFPLMFVQQFLRFSITDLEIRRNESQIQKALHKANARLNKAVLEDFEAMQNALAQENGKS